MARIDYYGLEVKVKELLDREFEGQAVTVSIEDELNLIEGPAVIIYLDARTTPIDRQSIAAGRRLRMTVELTLLCIDRSFESIADACRHRDDLIGRVEIALMKYRDLEGLVTQTWFEGGRFSNAYDDKSSGFASAGEVRLMLDVTATL